MKLPFIFIVRWGQGYVTGEDYKIAVLSLCALASSDQNLTAPAFLRRDVFKCFICLETEECKGKIRLSLWKHEQWNSGSNIINKTLRYNSMSIAIWAEICILSLKQFAVVCFLYLKHKKAVFINDKKIIMWLSYLHISTHLRFYKADQKTLYLEMNVWNEASTELIILIRNAQPSLLCVWKNTQSSVFLFVSPTETEKISITSSVACWRVV